MFQQFGLMDHAEWVVLVINVGLLLVFALLTLKRWMPLSVLFSLALLVFTMDAFLVASVHALDRQNNELETNTRQIGLLTARLDSIQKQQESYSTSTDFFRKMAEQQANISATNLSQSRPTDITDVREAIVMRDDLISQLESLKSQPEVIQNISDRINLTIHQFLFEEFSRELMEGIGRKAYGKFLKTRERDEWSDELFIKDVKPYLENKELMTAPIEQSLAELEFFDTNKKLLEKKNKSSDKKPVPTKEIEVSDMKKVDAAS